MIGAAQDSGQEPQDNTGLPNVIWKRGIAISSVPLNLDGKSKKRVGTGSYIVNAQVGCADCHTNPLFLSGGDPFRGQARMNTDRYLAGGRAFGPFTSRNITPDAAGLPAGLTFDQFVEVMRTGKAFKNRHPLQGPLLQVMPWPLYTSMTDDDLSLIYEYLQAIPHAEPAQ